jgi:exodeoxyribonuclease V alpha subunit
LSALGGELRAALADGHLRPIEAAMADWCLRHGGARLVALAFAMTVRAVHEGHSCWYLPEHDVGWPGAPASASAGELVAALRQSGFVGAPGAGTPLILDGSRLYLQRYHDYERRLAQRLHALMSTPPDVVNVAALQAGGGMFDYGWVAPGTVHWQAVAAFVAMRRRLTVISGGPGTGKTYVVLRLMRLLIESALARGAEPPAIRLAAPTGKAAARMVESTRAGLTTMALPPETAACIPTEAHTLHRLLGLYRHRTRAVHDAEHPLPLDVLIVDEASMVDLPLMTKLIEALPARARLILLGDRYQLASVESGSVLAEICDVAGVNAFSAEQVAASGALLPSDAPAATRPPIADHVVTLQTSHRFQPDSPIGRIAAAVNAGDLAAVERVLAAAGDSVRYVEARDVGAIEPLIEQMAASAAALFERGINPDTALAQFERHRILTATRVGPLGSEALNRAMTSMLAERHGFDAARRWYAGRPVLVTENDYRARLFNGDTGIALPGTDGRLRVWFAGESGQPRAFLPSALPAHETAWAMTVHKSQGSEFEEVTLVLPLADVAVLTRELIYTGITRARQRVTLFGSLTILSAGIARRSRRHSGLSARLTDVVGGRVE